MHRIDNTSASPTLPPHKPPGIPGFFTVGNPATGLAATIVEADWLNDVQEELLAILARAEIAPDKSNNTQVIEAILSLIGNSTRLRLTGPLTLFVAPAPFGSDLNNGLTPETAFATPQRAWNYIMERLDVGAQVITVQMADGVYPALSCTGSPIGSLGQGVVFRGNHQSPAAVTIQGVNQPAVNVGYSAMVVLADLRLTASGAAGSYDPGGTGIIVGSNSAVAIDGVEFGPCTYAHMYSNGGAVVAVTPYYVTGGAAMHALFPTPANGISLVLSTCNLVGSPSFSVAFFAGLTGGLCNAYSMDWSGGFIGKRFQLDANAILSIGGADPNTYIPGTIEGTTARGSILG